MLPVMRAAPGVGAAFANRVTPAAVQRRKFADGLLRIAQQNRSNAASLSTPQQSASPVQAAPPGPAGPQMMTPLLPPPAIPDEQTAGDPNAALDEFTRQQLGDQEFRINRRHPSREPRAVGGLYGGMRASQAKKAVEDKFIGLPDATKAALESSAGGLQFRQQTPAPQTQTQPLTGLQPPQKATGEILGGNKFTLLQPRRPGAVKTTSRAT